MTTDERITIFRKDIQGFLVDLETHNTYRKDWSSPNRCTKGLCGGCFGQPPGSWGLRTRIPSCF